MPYLPVRAGRSRVGWIVYPPLGTAVALLNLAFVLACLAAYAVRRFTRRSAIIATRLPQPPDRDAG